MEDFSLKAAKCTDADRYCEYILNGNRFDRPSCCRHNLNGQSIFRLYEKKDGLTGLYNKQNGQTSLIEKVVFQCYPHKPNTVACVKLGKKTGTV